MYYANDSLNRWDNQSMGEMLTALDSFEFWGDLPC